LWCDDRCHRLQHWEPRSVSNALTALNVEHQVLSTPLAGSPKIDTYVLPGVGAADVTMASLRSAGWDSFLADRLSEGAKYLGICIGMQIMFGGSEEGDTECLGWLPGSVARLDRDSVRVPQMGWNTVAVTENAPKGINLVDQGYYYYVNSYYARCDARDLYGVTDYGEAVPAVVGRKNMIGVQFHAEKSGVLGLQLLKSLFAPSGDNSAWDVDLA